MQGAGELMCGCKGESLQLYPAQPKRAPPGKPQSVLALGKARGCCPSPHAPYDSRVRVLSQCDGHTSAKRERVLAPWPTAFITQSTVTASLLRAGRRAGRWQQTKRDLRSLCSSPYGDTQQANKPLHIFNYKVQPCQGCEGNKRWISMGRE